MMSERGYSISKDKTSMLYKQLPKKQQGSLYLQVKKQDNRYKDIYHLTSDGKSSVCSVDKMYINGELAFPEETLYQYLNQELSKYGKLPIDKVSLGLKEVTKVASYYFRKHELVLDSQVVKGQRVLPTNVWTKIWSKYLKTAIKNKDKMEHGARLANLFFDDYLRFGQEGRIYLSQTYVGNYRVQPMRNKNKTVWVLIIQFNQDEYKYVLGYDKIERERELNERRAIESIIAITDHTKEISLDDLKLYSESYYEELELNYIVDDEGELYYDMPQVIQDYLNATIKEYDLVQHTKSLKNIRVNDTQILYNKVPIAEYELTVELVDSKYPLSFYEATLHIEFSNSDNTSFIIGYYEYTEDATQEESDDLLDEFSDLGFLDGEEGGPDEWDEYSDSHLDDVWGETESYNY